LIACRARTTAGATAVRCTSGYCRSVAFATTAAATEHSFAGWHICTAASETFSSSWRAKEHVCIYCAAGGKGSAATN
jgi:hypothetical protein